MPYPGLAHDDHRILGSDYCSGFTDIYGKWNTGFYCPQTSPTIPVFCCGTTYYKYCCVARGNVLREKELDLELQEDIHPITESYTVKVPVVFAIFCGIVAVVVLLVTAICFFCSCCIVYKKRRNNRDHHAPFSGLYHIQGSSSANSALTSIYSNQNTNSSVVTTPLDSTEWSSGYIPYPYLNPHYATPFSTPSSVYPSSLTINGSSNNRNLNNNNNNLSAFYYNNLNNNQQSQENRNLFSLSALYRQQQQLRPHGISSMSTLSTLSRESSPQPRYFHPNQNAGLYHVTNLSQSAASLPPPPPPYTFRPITSPAAAPTPSRHVELTTQLQLVQSSPAPLFNHQGPRTNNQPNTTRALNPNVNVNGRQFEQTRSNINYNNNSSRQSRNNQEERLSLATIQSLINAYRNVSAGSRAATQPLQSCPPPPPPPTSLTTADVNRLNAINLLVSTLLNQNQRQQNQRRNGGESAPGVGGAAIRASSGSGGGISKSNTCSSVVPPSSSSSSGIGSGCSDTSSASLPLPPFVKVPLSLQEDSDHENDEEIIQIIETSVPLTVTLKEKGENHGGDCFDVDKGDKELQMISSTDMGDNDVAQSAPLLQTNLKSDLFDLEEKSNFNADKEQETSVLIDELQLGDGESVDTSQTRSPTNDGSRRVEIVKVSETFS